MDLGRSPAKESYGARGAGSFIAVRAEERRPWRGPKEGGAGETDTTSSACQDLDWTQEPALTSHLPPRQSSPPLLSIASTVTGMTGLRGRHHVLGGCEHQVVGPRLGEVEQHVEGAHGKRERRVVELRRDGQSRYTLTSFPSIDLLSELRNLTMVCSGACLRVVRLVGQAVEVGRLVGIYL